MLNKLRYYIQTVHRGMQRDFAQVHHHISQQRVYKFFRCPSCKSRLRVGRGKGKIQITCPRCGLRFRGRS